jgi:hypothetical protein
VRSAEKGRVRKEARAKKKLWPSLGSSLPRKEKLGAPPGIVSPRPLTVRSNDNRVTSTGASMRKLIRSLRERGGAWGSAAHGCGVGLQRRDGVIAWRRAARVGPTRVRTVGKATLGEKNIYVFGRNALQIAIFWYFIVLPPYPPPKKHMTGGSSVRGKADPN